MRGFAQYARGFRAPPAYDVNLGIDIAAFNARALPNPDLDPERSHAYEVGLRHRGAHAGAELSLFETQYEDFILSNAFVGTDPDTGTRLFQSRNVERAWIRGMELRWRQDLSAIGAHPWFAELAAAWLRGENRDSDKPLPTIDPARIVFALDRETGEIVVRDVTTLSVTDSTIDATVTSQLTATIFIAGFTHDVRVAMLASLGVERAGARGERLAHIAATAARQRLGLQPMHVGTVAHVSLTVPGAAAQVRVGPGRGGPDRAGPDRTRRGPGGTRPASHTRWTCASHPASARRRSKARRRIASGVIGTRGLPHSSVPWWLSTMCVSRSISSRGTDCAVRQGLVGSWFAYRQLLIQPIMTRRSSGRR